MKTMIIALLFSTMLSTAWANTGGTDIGSGDLPGSQLLKGLVKISDQCAESRFALVLEEDLVCLGFHGTDEKNLRVNEMNELEGYTTEDGFFITRILR